MTLLAHLAQRTTTVCRCWSVRRRDGGTLGFTDHDVDLVIDGVVYSASSGLTARALEQTTGLSVDNSEAVGVLSDSAVSETDLRAGRYDGADVRCWLVNWADVSERMLLFRGSIGEVTQGGGAFRAELRGMTEALNRVQGRVFQGACDATLGDARCGLDLPSLRSEAIIAALDGDRAVTVQGSSQDSGWYALGQVEVLTGPAAGLSGRIRQDRFLAPFRRIELWQELPVTPRVGDQLRLTAGCDRLAATCRTKFANFANFRGFPHIPGDDWLASYPVRAGQNDGGSLRREP